MPLPKASELLKLAKACRKAGITKFKSPEYEFELGEDPTPKTLTKKNKMFIPLETQGEIESDIPTPEELLFWSSGPIVSEGEQQ